MPYAQAERKAEAANAAAAEAGAQTAHNTAANAGGGAAGTEARLNPATGGGSDEGKLSAKEATRLKEFRLLRAKKVLLALAKGDSDDDGASDDE